MANSPASGNPLRGDEVAAMIASNTRTVQQTLVNRSGEWVALARFAAEAGMPENTVRRWERHRLMFSVDHDGVGYYPLFALDRTTLHPKTGLRFVIETFRAAERSSWDLAFWLCTPHALLGGKRPADLLDKAPTEVFNAARESVQSSV